MLKIITVGKKPPTWINEPVQSYSKRLHARFKPKWIIIPNSAQADPETAKNAESTQILNKVGTDFLILLDETGKNFSSPEIAEILDQKLTNNICLVIGGAYGVSNQLKTRANIIWSLSRLVFPHQIVRLILIEQLYRAQCIIEHHPYHHQ
ncbi:MAG: 23S rRNA (pseudouridine(1915)-N(3))-methyltransferase RlmH [Candidatus Saccharibacteria bacterium]|nr:23S rRNA (pseudouridine(1915)-N(3))-methyltransferase RlmH [Candidatus Saccharibacteria bacterium]